MPPKIPVWIEPRIWERVAEMLRLGQKPSGDKLWLELNPKGQVVGRTKVFTLMKKAVKAIKWEPQPDPPWNPSPMEWPAEAYSFLLALDRFCLQGVESDDNDTLGVLVSRRLTKSEARWGARLYAVCREAPTYIALHIAKILANRETMGKMYQQPMDLTDVASFLQYRPWESTGANETYEVACNLGIVPRISYEPPVGLQTPESHPPNMSDLERVGEIKRVGETEDIRPTSPATLEDATRQLEEALGSSGAQEVRQLESIMERAMMVQVVAIKKIQAVGDSKGQDEQRSSGRQEGEQT